MKKVYYPIIFKKAIDFLFSKKIIGQASKEEIPKIYEPVAKLISTLDTKRTEDEIYQQLIKNEKIASLNQSTFDCLVPYELDDFTNLNLNDFKRYRLENEEQIFEMLTQKTENFSA